MTARRLLPLLAVSVLAVVLAACGNKQAIHTVGHTEGAYLDVGGLTYQVQISRVLNPSDNEDRGYLVDLPLEQRELAPDEAWFGVFVLVQNTNEQAYDAAEEFEIRDTQDDRYLPIELGPDNVFAYRPGPVEPGDTLPAEDTAALNNPSVNGGLLLFKVKNFSFDNRPLELEIHSPGDVEPALATVDLDV